MVSLNTQNYSQISIANMLYEVCEKEQSLTKKIYTLRSQSSSSTTNHVDIAQASLRSIQAERIALSQQLASCTKEKTKLFMPPAAQEGAELLPEQRRNIMDRMIDIFNEDALSTCIHDDWIGKIPQEELLVTLQLLQIERNTLSTIVDELEAGKSSLCRRAELIELFDFGKYPTETLPEETSSEPIDDPLLFQVRKRLQLITKLHLQILQDLDTLRDVPHFSRAVHKNLHEEQTSTSDTLLTYKRYLEAICERSLAPQVASLSKEAPWLFPQPSHPTLHTTLKECVKALRAEQEKQHLLNIQSFQQTFERILPIEYPTRQDKEQLLAKTKSLIVIQKNLLSHVLQQVEYLLQCHRTQAHVTIKTTPTDLLTRMKNIQHLFRTFCFEIQCLQNKALYLEGFLRTLPL